MNNNYINTLDLLLSLKNINKYPYNLNIKLKDNIIETKKEIELEYIKNYILTDSEQKNNIKGANEINVLIF
jgi:hypothetical protein